MIHSLCTHNQEDIHVVYRCVSALPTIFVGRAGMLLRGRSAKVAALNFKTVWRSLFRLILP